MERQTHDKLVSSIRRIIRAVDIHSRDLLKRYGLTGPQLTILRAINESPDLSVSKLATTVSLSQATVTNILSRLEHAGYLTRSRGSSDKRKVYLAVTEKSRRILEGTPKLLRKDFLEKFFALKDWEQTLLLSSLQRIATMMDDGEPDAAQPSLYPASTPEEHES